MGDMLVRLYALTQRPEEIPGVTVRRPLPHETDLVKGWIDGSFGGAWASEFEGSFKRFPITAFIALRDQSLIGFACYEATSLGYFGPVGVAQAERGKGIGRHLLMRCLWGLQELGYAYAFIGGADKAAEFYARTIGAVPIPDSSPGIYPAVSIQASG